MHEHGALTEEKMLEVFDDTLKTSEELLMRRRREENQQRIREIATIDEAKEELGRQRYPISPEAQEITIGRESPDKATPTVIILPELNYVSSGPKVSIMPEGDGWKITNQGTHSVFIEGRGVVERGGKEDLKNGDVIYMMATKEKVRSFQILIFTPEGKLVYGVKQNVDTSAR